MKHPRYEKASMTRGEFIRRAGLAGATAMGAGYLAFAPEDAPLSLRDVNGQRSIPEPESFRLKDFRVAKPGGMTQDIGIARGPRGVSRAYTIEEKRNLLKASLDAIGGIRHYVHPGDVVLVKPNVGYDRAAILGATSDPEMLGELIRILLWDARASEVRVTDNPIESPPDCFRTSGIGAATSAANGRVYLPHEYAFTELLTPGAQVIERCDFFSGPFAGVDKVIGFCPVKDHVLCQASISIKNWYGLLGRERNKHHKSIHEVVSDFTLMIKPTLTIIDGTRILAEYGPTGGERSYVHDGDVVMSGLDPVAMDAWAFEHLLDRGTVYPKYLHFAEVKGGGWVGTRGRIKEVHTRVELA